MYEVTYSLMIIDYNIYRLQLDENSLTKHIGNCIVTQQNVVSF